MVTLMELWLPILLSAVAVFVASSVLHMVLTYHRSDYSAVPGEDRVQAAMRAEGLQPGYYYLPHCVDMKAMAEPEMQEKFKQGPVAFLTVLPSGLPSMGKPLISWFVYCLVLGVVIAYLTGQTVAPGTDFMRVFQIAGTAALLGYAGALPGESIWKGLPWSITLKHLFDSLVYGLVTGAVFAWLWPG